MFCKFRVLPIVALILLLNETRAQEPHNPLKITKIAPESFRLDWQADALRSFVIEGSPDLRSWVGLGKPVVGTGIQRSLIFSSPASKFFFRLRTGAMRPGFDEEALIPEDDHSSSLRALPFTVNFFGSDYTNCYINNNGNITFSNPFSTFTPADLRTLSRQIIAAFWADVDTLGSGSNVTRYSKSQGSPNFQQEYVDGHRAFGATYSDVGYFSASFDKLNSFQIILIERADTGPKNFDVEFNYNKIQWETGGANGSQNGYGGTSARVGISGRKPNPSTERFSMEVTGSGTPGAFLDQSFPSGLPNTASGLIYGSWNSGIPGRLVFQFRNGVLQGSMRVEAGPDQNLLHSAPFATTLQGLVSVPSAVPYTLNWTQTSGDLAIVVNPGSLTPTVTLPGPGDYTFRLTATTTTNPPFSTFDEILVHHDDEVLTVFAGDWIFLEADDPFSFTLTGQATFTSNDPISVVWTQSFGEPATIAAATSLVSSVTLPSPGYYEFTLTANTTRAGRNYTESSVVSVFHADYELVVNAGASQYLNATDPFTATLAGEASFTGPEALTHVWVQTYGDAAVISDPNILNPQVTLPGAGYYEFTLTATTATTPPRSLSSATTIQHEQP